MLFRSIMHYNSIINTFFYSLIIISVRNLGHDDEVTVDATAKNSEVVLADIEPVGEPPMVQKHPNADENSPPQDAMVSLNFVIGSEIVLTCDFQEGQENVPPPIRPAKSDPILAQSSVSSKTVTPNPASCFSRLNYSYTLASEEKPASMAEIIRRENWAAGTASIKSYSSVP